MKALLARLRSLFNNFPSDLTPELFRATFSNLTD